MNLWAGHYEYVYSYSVGFDFSRQSNVNACAVRGNDADNLILWSRDYGENFELM